MQEFYRWKKAHQATYFDNLPVLSTVTALNEPRSRLMRVIQMTNQGFVFSTYANSPKMQDIKKHPVVSLLYLWPQSDSNNEVITSVIQIEITGKVEPVGPLELLRPNKSLAQGFNQYLVKPDRVDFTLSYTKSRYYPIVEHHYVRYSKSKQTWTMQRSTSLIPKTKLEMTVQ